MAGTLEIDNAGDIIGFGGAANGGAGGNAIQNSASGVTINNTGLLAGGGGGGGSGGAGGSGEVNNTADWSGREPAASWTNGSASVGYYWNVSSYHFLYSGGTSYIIWASNIGSQSGFPSFIRIGNNEYHRGPHRGSNKYEIYRQAKTIIAGGVGGSGGIGQGLQSNKHIRIKRKCWYVRLWHWRQWWCWIDLRCCRSSGIVWGKWKCVQQRCR